MASTPYGANQPLRVEEKPLTVAGMGTSFEHMFETVKGLGRLSPRAAGETVIDSWPL